MILAALVALAVVTQVVITKSWIAGDTENLLEAGI